jgi:hypothetical protein
MMNSKPSNNPISTLRHTIIDREPATPSPDLASLHRLEAESQGKATGPAKAHGEIWSPRSETGTLWVRPWGGK